MIRIALAAVVASVVSAVDVKANRNYYSHVSMDLLAECQ